MTSGTRPGRLTNWLWFAAAAATPWLCTISGCAWPRNSPVIVVPDSERVIFLEPNQPAAAPWPAVILSRGRYLELIEAEMIVQSGRVE